MKNKYERRRKNKKRKNDKRLVAVWKNFRKWNYKKKKNYIKIIKVIPINYDLKSNLEKEAILNAYKLFLKTCDFNIQILVQSKKEDLSKHISNINQIISNEKNPKIIKMSENYIEYIKEKNNENKSSSKNYYIILKSEVSDYQLENHSNFEKIAVDNLQEMFFKVKESLSRCGNLIQDINSKQEIMEILKSFYNPRMVEK